MPEDDPGRATDEPRFEAPHPNGAGQHATAPPPVRRPPGRVIRILLTIGILVVLVAWGYAIWFSVAAPDPEKLTDAETEVLRSACVDARRTLKGLDPEGDTLAERAVRIKAENEAISQMVSEFESVQPEASDSATALEGWIKDWRLLVTTRADYADELDAGRRPEFKIPAAENIKPITQRMNNYAEKRGVSECSTDTLQAEIIGGTRDYDNPAS